MRKYPNILIPAADIGITQLTCFFIRFPKFMYSLRDYQAGFSKITKIIKDYIDVRENIRRLAAFASCAFASRAFASRAFVFRAFASRAFASRALASRAFASRRPRPKPEEEHAMSSQQSYFHVISTIILPCMQIVPTRALQQKRRSGQSPQHSFFLALVCSSYATTLQHHSTPRRAFCTSAQISQYPNMADRH